MHYPVCAGRQVNLVAFAPAGRYTTESWTATATIGEFGAEFAGWDHRLTRLIEAAGTPGRWALLDRAPLDRWSKGTVTLLGDAAHPMFPFFAQGAAQSIEDVAVLAACLTGPPAAGTASRRCCAGTNHCACPAHDGCSRSVTPARINHLPDGPEQRSRDAAFATTGPLAANGWIYRYDPDAEPADPWRRPLGQ